MIKSKLDLKYYLECDRIGLRAGKKAKRGDYVYRYERLLRKTEYYHNIGNKIMYRLHSFFLNRLGMKLGFSIPLNKVGPGLSIAHPGTIIVNSNSEIGCNCRIQTGVTLGATNGSSRAPKIGNNVFLGDGCKIIGDVTIADDVQVGANAVVVKSILEEGTTWGGVPARKISNNSSKSNIVCATEIYQNEYART